MRRAERMGDVGVAGHVCPGMMSESLSESEQRDGAAEMSCACSATVGGVDMDTMSSCRNSLGCGEMGEKVEDRSGPVSKGAIGREYGRGRVEGVWKVRMSLLRGMGADILRS
jgi:hypothetical protein